MGYEGLHRVANTIYRACFLIGIFLAIGMTSIVVINIISRYFFNFAISWAEEVARYMMVWMVMLGAVMGVRMGMHFRMEMIDHWAGKTSKAVFSWATRTVIILMGLILLRHGLVMVSLTNSQYADATQMPMSWVYVSLPLSGLLMIFFVVERSLQPKR